MNQSFKDLPKTILLRGGPMDGQPVPNEGLINIRYADEAENIASALQNPQSRQFHHYHIHPEGHYEYQGYY